MLSVLKTVCVFLILVVQLIQIVYLAKVNSTGNVNRDKLIFAHTICRLSFFYFFGKFHLFLLFTFNDNILARVDMEIATFTIPIQRIRSNQSNSGQVVLVN